MCEHTLDRNRPQLPVWVSEKADCVESDDKFLGGVTGAAPSFAVKIDQGPKSLGFSANDGDHQGKSECAGANE